MVVNLSLEPIRVVSVFFDRKDERQTMRLHVDQQADALYLRLDESKIVESEEVSPGVVLDFNAENQAVVSHAQHIVPLRKHAGSPASQTCGQSFTGQRHDERASATAQAM